MDTDEKLQWSDGEDEKKQSAGRFKFGSTSTDKKRAKAAVPFRCVLVVIATEVLVVVLQVSIDVVIPKFSWKRLGSMCWQ